MAYGASVYAVAKELRTGTRTIYDALRRHRLTWPPSTAGPVERLAYIDDDEVRTRAAQRIVDDAEALAERAPGGSLPPAGTGQDSDRAPCRSELPLEERRARRLGSAAAIESRSSRVTSVGPPVEGLVM